MAKTIFNVTDGIIAPCNVARSWHWFRQVTAPCNMACGSGITTVNSPSGSTLQCDTWLWDEMPMDSPGGSTLQCAALGSWHWIRQVAAPCNVTDGFGMTRHGIRSNIRHIGILRLVSIFIISPQSTCHSAPVCEILSKSHHLRQKKWRVDFQDGGSQPSWILSVH